MTPLLDKIWLYFGWFYLSLFAAFWLSFKFPKEALAKSFTILSLVVGIYFSTQELLKIPKLGEMLFLSYSEKIDKATFGQAQFAGELKAILPKNASGCIFWSWDIPTRFLSQRLYPRLFVPIEEDEGFEQCGYLISQFEPKTVKNFKLIYQSQRGYLYQKQQ